jgi:hypothetical protein
MMAGVASLAIALSPTACADCEHDAEFPDIDSFPAVNLANYAQIGTHPSTSVYRFTTPAGVQCVVSMITEMGVQCWGAPVGAAPQSAITASTLTAAAYSEQVPILDGAAKLLPIESKLDAGNGVVCAVITDDTVACRAGPNAAMASDDPAHHGVHGFVIQPSGNWTF